MGVGPHGSLTGMTPGQRRGHTTAEAREASEWLAHGLAIWPEWVPKRDFQTVAVGHTNPLGPKQV
jgi:hypothetical protein